MGFVNEYKAKALDCVRKAHHASPGDTRRELIDLALAYTQLAELAEGNAVTVETGMMQPQSGRALTATLEALPIRMQDIGKPAWPEALLIRMQGTGKAATRHYVPASIGRQLRQLCGENLRQIYGGIPNEPVPDHLMVFVRRLDNSKAPLVRHQRRRATVRAKNSEADAA